MTKRIVWYLRRILIWWMFSSLLASLQPNQLSSCTDWFLRFQEFRYDTIIENSINSGLEIIIQTIQSEFNRTERSMIFIVFVAPFLTSSFEIIARSCFYNSIVLPSIIIHEDVPLFFDSYSHLSSVKCIKWKPHQFQAIKKLIINARFCAILKCAYEFERKGI